MGDSKRLLSVASLALAAATMGTSASEPLARAADASQPSPRAANVTVLVVGNSIGAAAGIQSDQGWVHLLRERMGQRAKVINASISGDTTSGGLARLPRTLAEHEPDVVVIELGGNDGLRGYPVANIRENLLAMTKAVAAAGAKPLLAGMRIPPNYGPRYAEAFHAMYGEIAAETGAALVPFLLEGVATDRALMQEDGIHPTAAAQGRLLDNVWPALAPLLGGAGE